MALSEIEHAAQLCRYKGCQMESLRATAAGALSLVSQTTGRTHMSQALWCDQGGHAFSERDPGRQRISIAVLDEESGQEKMESRDFCGACAQAAGLYTPRKTRPAAIVAPPSDMAAQAAAAEREDDHAMLRDLQRQLAELRAQGKDTAGAA